MKFKQIKTTFLLFSLLLIQNVFGQNQNDYFIKTINKFNSNFDQNIVTDLMFDDDKILWIATPTGIFCYNGIEVKQIKTPNNNRCVSFFKTAENKNLILFADGNVYQIKKEGFKFYYKDKNQKDYTWNYKFLTLPYGFLNKIITSKKIKSSYFFSKVKYINNENVIYTSTKSNHTYIYKINLLNMKTRIIDSFHLDIFSEYIIIDNNIFGNLKNGKAKEVYCPNHSKIDPFPKTIKATDNYKLFNKNGAAPVLISKKNVWVLILNKNRNTYEWKIISSKLPTDLSFQSGIYIQELDKLFLGTESDGLLIISKSNFHTKFDLNKVSKSNYYIQIPDLDGDIITNGENINKEKKHKNLFNNQWINNNYKFIDKETIITSNPGSIFTYNLKTKQNKTKHRINPNN